MYRLFSTGIETLAAAVVLIPAFLLLNQHSFHDRKRTAAYTVFALYLAAMYAVAGLPNITYFHFEPNFNFHPFAYMFSDYENSILNVILFLPLGIFLPVLWRRFLNGGWTVLFGLCASAFIEILQIFSFRATDVNDLMTNTLGTALGYGIARIVLRFVPGLNPGKKSGEAYVVFGTVLAVMFFLQPYLSSLLWELIL